MSKTENEKNQAMMKEMARPPARPQNELLGEINNLHLRLGQKDMALAKTEALINRLVDAIQGKDDEINNLKIDIDRLKKEAKSKKKKNDGAATK